MPQHSVRSAVEGILRAGAATRGVAGAAAYRAGCAAVLIALSGTAVAQQQDKIASGDTAAAAGTLEEVVVTGIRRGIENAIEVKKDSGSIVEAISAEDLGKLPDTSIADSLSRLPGLTSQRAEGRASAISLRGTDPGFTSALLNGREQVSTGDNRSIEFEQYPSELLSAVVVYKTPDANLVGQGLAGTIDLRTQRPLEYGKRALAFNIRGEQNSNDDLGADSKDDGYRVSLSYIDQFMDGKLGVAFGVARLDQPLATRGAGTYEPWSPWTPNPGQPTRNVGVPAGTYLTNGAKIRVDMGDNVRTGAMAALQFKPTDSYETILDLYYTKREQENNARSLEVNLGDYPAPCCDGPFPPGTQFGYSNPTIVDNTVVGATLNSMVPLARNFLFKTEDEITAIGWNNKFTFGEWQLVGDLSYSKAERKERQYETNAQIAPRNVPGQPRNVYDTGTFQLREDDFPTLSFLRNYADPATVQVGPTIYGAGYSKIPDITDELVSARIDLDRTLDWMWFDGVAFGVNYADREKDKVQPEGGINTRSGGFVQVPTNCLLDPTNLSYASANNALAWDVNCVLASTYAPIVYGTPTTPGFDYLIGKNWSVQEKVATGYVRTTLNHELSDTVTLRGNLGVQVINTDQSSDAFYKDNVTGRVLPRTDGKKYTDVLPAFNLAFVLPDSQAVRVGISRQIARARMDQLKASSEFGWDQATGRPGGSGGNPQLDPWRANAFDLSYEKYFAGNRGYVSLAAFYKDLKSYIYNQANQSYDFSEILANTTFPPGYFPPGVTPGTTGTFTQPVNGEGGSLKGAEFAVSLPSELFFENITGFGVILSYSYTDSGIEIVDGGGNNFLTGNNLGTIPLPGLSKNVWNATAYYENAGFSARIATRARSEYIGEVTNFANDRALKYVKGDQITDAQIGYAFSGRFEGLSVLFQVNNLTNEPYVAYAVSETRQQDIQDYGRQYLLGINYRL
jgi:TonB-dependent receptor